MPTRSAVSAVIGSLLEVPRMPSVPKSLRVIEIPDPVERTRDKVLIFLLQTR
jgi:hypothetical protein